jgi:hypothetical protein
MNTAGVRVVRSTEWQSHHGGSCGYHAGGLYGQLTECELADGTRFYVRENNQQSSFDRFVMSSNARQGIKKGRYVPGVQVLELAAPATKWAACAAAVAAADSLGRPVQPNRAFTAEWAEAHLGQNTRRRRGR